jgi:hypothetical protein
VFWTNVCGTIENAVHFYNAQRQERELEFSGREDHAVSVTAFDRPKHTAQANPELDRVTITLNSDAYVIEVGRVGKSTVMKFPITVSGGGLRLEYEGEPITLDRFTELVLQDTMFPTTQPPR